MVSEDFVSVGCMIYSWSCWSAVVCGSVCCGSWIGSVVPKQEGTAGGKMDVED